MTGEELLALGDDKFNSAWFNLGIHGIEQLAEPFKAAGIRRYSHLGVGDVGEDRKPRSSSANEHRALVEQLWNDGLPSGSKTGWASVDKHYTVLPGQLSIITGWPGAGKSEWLDALMVNLMRQSWKFAVFSAENMPVQFHIQKLMEKLAGAPFGVGRTARIPFDEIAEWCDELSNAIRFITHDASPTMPELLRTAEKWLLTDDDRKRGLLIDPWNQLDHYRAFGMSETEFIRDTLNNVRNWARKHEVHVWIVAHPQKMPRDKGELPIPRPDMISGSQHWWNIADCAIAVWRDPDEPNQRTVDIIVQKIRFKHIGSPGVISLDYDRVTGRYSMPNAAQMHIVGKDGE